MPALANFLRDELHRRDWSPEEFARRCVPPVSTSLAYQIIRDNKDNVRQSTFNSIAAAFGMTPTAFHAVIYSGQKISGQSPDELDMLHHYRRVPPEERRTALRLVRALGDELAQRRPSARHDARSSRLKAKQRELEQGLDGPISGAEDSEAPCYPRAGRLLLTASRPLVAPIGA